MIFQMDDWSTYFVPELLIVVHLAVFRLYIGTWTV